MTPIEKNVRVVDEQGNEYEATYPKRAKGLVKNGRARFTDENTICLACPPNKIMEDNKMTDTEIKVNETTGEVIENAEGSTKYTIDYALEQLEKIREESERFAVETREKISEIKSAGPGDIGAEAAGRAMSVLVEQHSQMNNKLINFYIGMIPDPDKEASRKNAERKQFLDFVQGCCKNCDERLGYPDFEEIWNTMNA